ncbi:putative sigma-54 modulation protein [Hydrogenoanaerobacterium saccharovorans]|uniref:Ribosome hibernation promoting factor n=1 Tax=Hydrogenoanaerobacterium saccharovorans TaxID=474960 RepID=A0A1H7ZV53_9FIRM|nr:ribosome-associated translation inhibitor RaiA [Hydrogenoanaerobacterium saccharovorans]RPF48345.1 putative sigma-54 modulation protein [Hydrogenoanaerobacterium saccharovorans]SEM62522.1 putative sigma-54 modulation protein [Hydrogenoanaerobacterium saccharovorans]
MNITITARKTTVKDSFKERCEKKISKLDKFFTDDAKANVVVTSERERETVEVTIQSQGMFFRSEKTTADRLDSLDEVIDNLFRQIVKNKKKLGKRIRDDALKSSEVELLEQDVAEYHVVKIKKFPMKPMAVDEAILQMNMLGHEFYMFRNSDDNEINVVYKRNNGDYGLIEPKID